MSDLSSRERALIGLGAALGSNCVPCAEHHIRLARAAGVGDEAVRAAVMLADTIRQVPARKVLEAALQTLAQPVTDQPVASCKVLDAAPVGGTLDAITDTLRSAMAAEVPAKPAGGRSCC
jgi:4-carboxymuconolactone decarboxylase